jgi:hypothetical protein
MSDGSTLGDRMDGDYQPPILTEPKGGPIPVDGEPGQPDTRDSGSGQEPDTE